MASRQGVGQPRRIPDDRRVRIVALTASGKGVITPIFSSTSRQSSECLPTFQVPTSDNFNSI